MATNRGVLQRLAILSVLVLATLSAAQTPPARSSAPSNKVPVFVELFTSEGCSSCPPADEMLANIRNMQPISGEQIYVLSEHVDYWDHDGWKDRFSSPEATQRQVSYVQRLKVAEPYTPQMVVDGIIEFNGSDARAAQAAFEREQHVSKIPVTLTPVEPAGADVRVKVEVQNAPGQLDVILVTANSDATTPVKAGENNGKTLHHVNVMRSIEKLGTVKAGKSFSREVKLKPPSSKEGDAIAVVFAQDPKTGQVWGASSIPLRTGANPTRKP